MSEPRSWIGEAWEILDHVVEAVSVIGPDGRHLHVNAAARAILAELRAGDEDGATGDMPREAIATDGSPLPNERLPAEITRVTGEECDRVEVGFSGRGDDIRWLQISTRRLGEDGPPYGVVMSFSDVTARRQSETRLRAGEQRQRLVLRSLPGTIVALVNPAMRLVSVDGLVNDPLGRTDDGLRGEHLRDVLGLEAFAVAEPHVRAALGGQQCRFEHTARDGRVFETDAVPFHEAGDVTGALTLWRDVTTQRRLDAARRAAEQRFRQAFDRAPNGMVVVALSGRILQGNPALESLTRYRLEQLERLSILDLVAPDERPAVGEALEQFRRGELDGTRGDRHWLAADGSDLWVSVSTTLVRDADGRPSHVLGHVVDVTDRRRLEQELQHLAEHDPLTGLPNRRTFERALDRHLAERPAEDDGGAVLLLDLDGFKQLNDTRGHRAGDELMIAVARAIAGQLRRSDCIGRMGGDEFAVLLTEVDRHGAERVAEKLRGAVEREGTGATDGRSGGVTASIGVTMVGGRAPNDGSAVLAEADTAMYEAKSAGRNRVAFG